MKIKRFDDIDNINEDNEFNEDKVKYKNLVRELFYVANRYKINVDASEIHKALLEVADVFNEE
jgi:hypothetical protein